MDWLPLTSVAEFDELVMQSSENGSAFLIFKHSTRCMVSKMALRSFESDFRSDIPAYFVDLIEFRDLSNHIAKVSGVYHQSPQVITFKNGKVIYHDSHFSISASSSVQMV